MKYKNDHQYFLKINDCLKDASVVESDDDSNQNRFQQIISDIKNVDIDKNLFLRL